MLKVLFLATTLNVAVRSACVCGTACVMSQGGIGMCQPTGDCVANFVPPVCNSVSARAFANPTGTVPPRVSCPLVNCAAPNCPVDQQETPQNERGCSLCPRCRSGSLLSNMLGAPSPGADILRKQSDTGIPTRPCPLPMCVLPNCPESQHEILQNARGCPMCPVCKVFPYLFEAPSASTDILLNGVSSAPNMFGAPPTSTEPQFARANAPHCPLPACPPSNCPESLQEIFQNDQGCPMCPVCKVSAASATSESLAHCPAEEMPCPDGTWVGRKPPNCAFDLCPSGLPAGR